MKGEVEEKQAFHASGLARVKSNPGCVTAHGLHDDDDDDGDDPDDDKWRRTDTR